MHCRERCSESSASILAFGLTLAVGRYQNRRADVVTDANTIGTAYLRAQTIAEPQRSRSLALLRELQRPRDPRHATRSRAAQRSRATSARQGQLQQRALASRGRER